MATNGSDLRGITAGQRPVVPRAGLEPAAKRISPPEYQGVSLTFKNIEFPWLLGDFRDDDMPWMAVVFG